MPIQTRYAGDAQGVNNFDAATDGTLGTLIATGLTKSPTAIKITFVNTQAKAQAFTALDSSTGNAVETILRQIAIDSTIVMYQVDSTQLSVLVEATGNTTSAIAARVTSLGNISVTAGNVWGNNTSFSSSNGFKLA